MDTAHLLLLPFAEISLIVAVGLLLVMMVVTAGASGKGKASIVAMQQYLHRLQIKFNDHAAIDPETERMELEILQNRLKATCHKEEISAQNDLRQIFRTSCQSIIMAFSNKQLEDRSSWIKLKELMLSFDAAYFQGQNSIPVRNA